MTVTRISLRPRTIISAVIILLAGLASPRVMLGEDQAEFFRGINLGGPALMIDGRQWEAGDTERVHCKDSAFEDQSVRLLTSADARLAQMIRSSRWSPQGKANVTITGLPADTYSIFLYVWEDNDSQKFEVRLAGSVVAKEVVSGRAGEWQRLGPWVVVITGGKLELAARGGHANLSGLEIWRGTVAGEKLPEKMNENGEEGTSRDAQVAILLARNCLECHNASDKKGALDLTRRETALTGGETGSAIALDDPRASLLLKRIVAGEMPPEGRGKLSPQEQTLLADWLVDGAKWATDPIDPFLFSSDRRAGYNWWSLQPLQVVEPPPVVDVERYARLELSAVDQFLLPRLKQSGLALSPEADRRTLIRRLSFDLIGLPPTPTEVDAFVADADPQAYVRLVDRLLDSPHYGERWARHWLDIVRYGESQGFERNKFRESAWKYRDFVVEALNADLPYDEFVRWQIAGDVLEPDNPLAVIASGFLALGPYDLTAYNNGTADMRAFAREEELEGLVATVGQTFLGLTINCARCHDHKFDPITHKEFYQFSAALGGTYQGDERESLSKKGHASANQQIETLRSEISAFEQQIKTADETSRQELLGRIARAECVIRLLQGGPVHTTVPKQPDEWHILARGDFRQPQEIVAPGGIAAISGVSADWHLADNAPESERRVALARWITDPNNPLTPRVLVNRFWGHHFGQGLVRTPSDFGFQGGMPSHPELLDWLSQQLVSPESGPKWSLKRIHRLIVTSAAYRQSSQPLPKALEVDADNRLLWRYTRQRLEAETFRDSVLAVSGELDRSIGGPGFRDFTVSSVGNNETYSVFEGVGAEFNRRTLYRTCVRTGTSPLLDMLDCPDPSVATPQRSVTSTPLQALSLLNSKFMETYAQKFAERVERESPDDLTAQVKRAISLAFSRDPTPEDVEFGRRFATEHGLAQFCLVLFNANEFFYVD